MRAEAESAGRSKDSNAGTMSLRENRKARVKVTTPTTQSGVENTMHNFHILSIIGN